MALCVLSHVPSGQAGYPKEGNSYYSLWENWIAEAGVIHMYILAAVNGLWYVPVKHSLFSSEVIMDPLCITEYKVDGIVGITDCPYGSGEYITDREKRIVFLDPRKVGTNGCNRCCSFVYKDNKKKFVVCTGVTDVRA